MAVSGDRLTVFAHREAARGCLYEHHSASFGRTLTVPARCDAERVVVELRDGVLSLFAPARRPAT